MPDQPHPPDEVEAAFAAAVDRLAPLSHGARLVLGCSAGGDSMALLDLIARQAPKRAWAVAVAHIDHGQRPESAGEAEDVAHRAMDAGFTLFMQRLCPSAGKPLSEDAMRQARHDSFRRVAHVWQADALVLAHQLEDRAETLLMRLLNGSGPRGLGSIREVDRVAGLTLARPLLGIRREALRDYLRTRGLGWRDDPSNLDPVRKRAWLRHRWLPQAAEFLGYHPAEALARSARLVDEEAAAMAEAAGLILAELRRPHPPGPLAALSLDHPLWLKAGPLLRRQLIREWLWALRTGAHPPGLPALEEAMVFIEKGRRGARLRTVDGLLVEHQRTHLVAYAPDEAAP